MWFGIDPDQPSSGWWIGLGDKQEVPLVLRVLSYSVGALLLIGAGLLAYHVY